MDNRYAGRDGFLKVAVVGARTSVKSKWYGYRRSDLADAANIKALSHAAANHALEQPMHMAQGDLKAALKSYSDSLAIRERLAGSDPGNMEWQRDLSVSYERVGDVQEAQGDLKAAPKPYSDSLAREGWRCAGGAGRS
jgi:Flp pilus assembly protein TadD